MNVKCRSIFPSKFLLNSFGYNISKDELISCSPPFSSHCLCKEGCRSLRFFIHLLTQFSPKYIDESCIYTIIFLFGNTN
jgi:hypothetical protein